MTGRKWSGLVTSGAFKKTLSRHLECAVFKQRRGSRVWHRAYDHNPAKEEPAYVSFQDTPSVSVARADRPSLQLCHGGTTFIGLGFAVPAEGNCTPWSGFTKTASSVILTTTGTGCLSSDGKALTVSVSNADPSFFGAGQLRADYIRLTRERQMNRLAGAKTAVSSAEAQNRCPARAVCCICRRRTTNRPWHSYGQPSGVLGGGRPFSHFRCSDRTGGLGFVVSHPFHKERGRFSLASQTFSLGMGWVFKACGVYPSDDGFGHGEDTCASAASVSERCSV